MRRVTDRRWWSLGAIALLFALLALASPSTAAANVAPQCNAGLASQVLRTGKPLKLRVYCSDADLDTLTIAHSSPDHGTLGAFTFNPAADAYEATFTPAASYTGPDDFNFTASDGTVTTPTYGFNLIITENHAPRCEPNGAVHTKVDEAVQLNVFCSDQDAQDQDLTYTTIAGQGPDHGSLGPVTDLTVEYTPNTSFSGADHFTIRASDGTLADTYTQVVHVANTPLCATPPAVQIRSGSGRFLAVDCTRPADDTGTARYEIGTPPTKGTVSPSALSFNPERFYEANSGASGADSYTVRMTSSSGASPYVTQVIATGTAINHAPVCDIDDLDRESVYSDRPVELGIFCTDLDDDPISYAAAAAPDHGASATNDGRVIYTAEEGYIGFDEVPFSASDGHGGTTSGSFPVNVHAPEAPNCFQGAIAKSVRPGNSVRLELACASPQGDTQTYSATTPTKGTLGAFDGDGAVTYTANVGASGTDTFTMRADNPVGQSDPQPVTITVDASFNRAPQCNENPFTPKRVVKNTPRVLDLGSFCIDPDGDALAFERRSSPSHGSASAGPAETLTYTPNAEYLGLDSFTYVARDDRGVESAVATFSLNVVTSNAPTCTAPAPITLRPGQAKSVLLNCTDPDAEQLTYRIVTPPSGTLSPPGDSTHPVRTYTAPAAAGPDSFSYKAVSPGGESVVQTQQITVDPDFNSTPVCTPNSGFPHVLAQGRATPLPIATWCEDANGDPLSFTRAMPDPQHGTATASNGVITYTSDPGWTGPDSIGYVASDGHGGTVTQTFSVNVVVPVAPTCETPDPVDVRTGAGRTVDLRCFDDFGDELSFEITDPPDLGTLDPPGDGASQFRAYLAGGTEGDDAFSYRATSVNGTSNVVTQALHLDADANVAPSCIGNAGFPEAVAGGEATTLDPGCSDDDGDALGYTKLSEPAHGTLSDAGGALVYTPAGGYSGPDQFDFKATDGHGGESAPATHHVDVVAAEPPTCAPSDPVTLRPETSRSLVFDCDAVGGGLTYVIDTPPARGSLTGSGASRTFTAGTGEGDASFTWHAHSDAAGDSAPQTQTITIDAGFNVAPTCPASITISAEAGVQQTVEPACTDDDGDSLGFAKQSEPAHGTLTDSGGVLRYTATTGYNGTDSFTHRAADGHGGQSGIGTVTLNVTHTNQAPTCTGGPFDYEVEAGQVLALPDPPCTDADGETLSYEIVTPPAHGTLGAPGAGGGRTYTPDAGYTGEDSFTFRASDGVSQSSLQTVSITVMPPPNDPPTCSNVGPRLAPDVAATIQLACTDPDDDPVTLELVAGPAHGTLGAIDQGTDQVVYTPEPGYTGTDSFTYRATDGTLPGPAATVSIVVTGAPACEDVARTTEVGAPISLPLTCTDPDEDPLTLSIVASPSKGTLDSMSADSVTYTPDAGEFGSDSFTYRASDGTAQSAPATVSITITRPPICDDVSRTTAVGVPVSVPLTCTDDDGDAVTLSIVDGPSKGSLGPISGDAVTYTPDPGASGDDSFRYRANDGSVDSLPATVSITITRTPSCEDVRVRTAVGTAVQVPLECNDEDGDTLTLSIMDEPSKGALGAISGDAVTYTPDAGESGEDSFTYSASDGLAESALATVSITISRAPICEPVTETTATGTAVEIALDCTDPDGDPLDLEIVDGPSKGSLGSISGEAVTYTPAEGEFGEDSFTYSASDGLAESAPATASITISRAPSCEDVAVRTAVGTPVQVPLECTDDDGDALTLSIVDGPSKGSLESIAGDEVTYAPDAGEFGADEFTYRASDGTAQSAPATASITISRAPSCGDVEVRTEVGTAVPVPLECTDDEDDVLTLSIMDEPSKGSLGSISDAAVTYTPDAGAYGHDSFTYSASDGLAESALATVSITITRAPACEDVPVRTEVDTAVEVPLECTDDDGDELTLSMVDAPSKGSLGSIADDAVTYTPHAGEFGDDEFTYRASDGTAESALATVSITITQAPSCDDVSRTVAVGGSVSVPLTCTDLDGDELELEIVDGPSKGSLSSISGDAVSYTANAVEYGADEFTYRATDGTADSAPATASITITRAPACEDVPVRTEVDTAVSVPLECTDDEDDVLTLSIVDSPSKGSLGSISGDEITYTPDAGEFGDDEFTYRASDGTAESALATVSITITRAPTCDDVSRTTAAGGSVSVPLSCTDLDGDDLTLLIVDGPSKGSLGPISGDAVTYTPDAGEIGGDTFTYRASDDTAQSEPATVSITITRAPSCEDAAVRTPVGTAVQVPLECLDEDGDELTLSIVDGPSKGSLGSISGDEVTYTPAAGESGADEFKFRASDGTAHSAPATGSIIISRAPSCGDVEVRTEVGMAVQVPLECTDEDGDELTLSIVDGPLKGSLGPISDDEVTYTPDPGEFGDDSFTYRASDGLADSELATADVTITRSPTCEDAGGTAVVGSSVSVPLTCSDLDGDELTLAIQDGPSQGSLGAISDDSVTYTPEPDAAGEDTFTFIASDGTAESAPATVTITLTGAPHCAAASPKTAVGTSVSVPLRCTDPDGDDLTLSIVASPSKGTLGPISDEAATYTPNAGEFGADEFTYRANDGTADSAPATVSITISRPPSCEDVLVRTAVGAPVQVPLECTDEDEDALTLSIVDGPLKGSLGPISDDAVTYTPNAGESGADSFTYRATDGTAESPAANVNVTITLPPACDDVGETVRVGSSVSVPLTCSDPEGDELTLAIDEGPSQGSLGAISGDSVTYTPDADALGEDTFTFTASDGAAESVPATATITLTGPPRCDDVTSRTRIETLVVVPLTCDDPDSGDTLTLAIDEGPTKGSLGAISGDSVTYTPAAGEHGEDTFTYTANDGVDSSEPATATITITRAPICEATAVKTAVGEPISVPLSCSDEDGGTLTLAKGSDPAKGTLGAFSASSVTYTPAAGEYGDDFFTYTANDGEGDSAEATVAITITRPPVCEAVSEQTPAGEPVEIDLSCTDPDGDALTFSTVDQPSDGSVGEIAGGKVTYTPDAGYSGPDSFTYRASDGTAASAPATVSLTVIPPPNQAPSCEPVTETTASGTAVEIALDCTDPEGDPLEHEITGAPDHGSLGAVSGGKVTYTPDADHVGADSFTYRATDGDLESSPATVTLAVQAPPEVSLAVDRATAAEGSTLVFTATGSDADGTVEEYRYTVDGAIAQTGASRTLSRRFDAPGSHTVVVRAKDDDGRTATATRTVTITAKPAPPSGGEPSDPPAGGSPAGPSGGGPAPDTAAPAATLKAAKQKLKAVLAKGLAVTASCSEPCTLKLQLVIDKKTAKKLKLGKKPTVVGTLTRSLAGSAQLKIKLTGKAKKRLKRAKLVKLSVRAVATDAAGNAAAVVKTVTLKR